MLACEISLLNLNIQYIAVFIYAPARKEWKSEFWNELILYVNSLSLPFIILGDFNEISQISDKLGGAQYNSSRSLIMQNLFSNVSCIEIAFVGQRFTWRKKKAGHNYIYERLDRGVASSSWLGIFPQAKIKHHVFTSSDHCQISLDYMPKENTKAPPSDLKRCGVPGRTTTLSSRELGVLYLMVLICLILPKSVNF